MAERKDLDKINQQDDTKPNWNMKRHQTPAPEIKRPSG